MFVYEGADSDELTIDDLLKGEVLSVSEQVSTEEHHVKHAADPLETLCGISQHFFGNFWVTRGTGKGRCYYAS